MIMELAVLDVLQRSANESNGTARLSKRQIRQILMDEYREIHPDADEAEEVFSESKIRTAVDRLVTHNYAGGPLVECTTTHRGDGSEYRTGFYVEKEFTDAELLFLIDSVMYSGAVGSALAEDLTRRIKRLSGKRLDTIASYTSEQFFGERGSVSRINVLKNMDTVIDAIYANRYLTFTMNKYNMVGEQITLLPTRKHRVIPLQVFLNNGQYYMLAEYRLKGEVRTFRLDLMTDLNVTRQKIDIHHREVDNIARYRAEYIAQHPNVMGGKPERFTLRVNRDALTILVNTFGSQVQVLPGTVTDDTVDVRVLAAPQGMKQWLLVNYDSVSVVKASEDFVAEMEDAVAMLKEKYLK